MFHACPTASNRNSTTPRQAHPTCYLHFCRCTAQCSRYRWEPLLPGQGVVYGLGGPRLCQPKGVLTHQPALQLLWLLCRRWQQHVPNPLQQSSITCKPADRTPARRKIAALPIPIIQQQTKFIIGLLICPGDDTIGDRHKDSTMPEQGCCTQGIHAATWGIHAVAVMTDRSHRSQRP